MTGNTPLKLISMSEINAEEVQWLWYPYIPLGKLTILQGDPGEGKTSFILAVIAALTRGEPLPECERAAEPMNVIYQTAEDGLADTIKPRLESAGADCTRVLVIDEGKRELTLCDARLEEAIRRTAAKLIVLDPLQAYLGSDVDMHRANEVRPVLKQTTFPDGGAYTMRRHSDRAHEQGAGLEIRLSRSRFYRLPRFSQKRFDRRAAEKRRYAPHCRAGQEQPCTGGRSHCI